MPEEILTSEEIQEIIDSAKISEVLRIPNILSFGIEKTSIYKISPNNGIIFIKGDENTGFTHINQRHSFWSENHYWKEGNDKIILDDPSKFNRKSLPIIDYVAIADSLYSNENLNIEKNKNPNLFDLYSGFVEGENNGKAKYHMILYKGTRIIHTLYPHNKSNNRKKIINFRKGEPSGKMSMNPLFYSIAVPYHDNIERVKYSFQFTKTFKNKMEDAVLINHKSQESIKLFERNYELFNYDEDLWSVKYADLSGVERLIKQLEEREDK